MKVRIAFTVDIDNDVYADRFWPVEKDMPGRAAFIREEVQGTAASALIHRHLGGLIEDGGCLKGYDVKVWREDP